MTLLLLILAYLLGAGVTAWIHGYLVGDKPTDWPLPVVVIFWPLAPFIYIAVWLAILVVWPMVKLSEAGSRKRRRK